MLSQVCKEAIVGPLRHAIGDPTRFEPIVAPDVWFPITNVAPKRDIMGNAADGVYTGGNGQYRQITPTDWEYVAAATEGRCGELGCLFESAMTNLAHNGVNMGASADWSGVNSFSITQTTGPDSGQSHGNQVIVSMTDPGGVGIEWNNPNTAAFQTVSVLVYVPSSIRDSGTQDYKVRISNQTDADHHDFDVKGYDAWYRYEYSWAAAQTAGDEVRIMVIPKSGNIEASATVTFACVCITADVTGNTEAAPGPFPNPNDADLTTTGGLLTLGTDALPTDPTADFSIAYEYQVLWLETNLRIFQADYTSNFIAKQLSNGNTSFTYAAHDIGTGASGYSEGDWAQVLVTFDASAAEICFFLDGVLIAQIGSIGAFTEGTPSKLVIGSNVSSNAQQPEGFIRNYRMWNQRLERWSQAY